MLNLTSQVFKEEYFDKRMGRFVWFFLLGVQENPSIFPHLSQHPNTTQCPATPAEVSVTRIHFLSLDYKSTWFRSACCEVLPTSPVSILIVLSVYECPRPLTLHVLRLSEDFTDFTSLQRPLHIEHPYPHTQNCLSLLLHTWLIWGGGGWGGGIRFRFFFF